MLFSLWFWFLWDGLEVKNSIICGEEIFLIGNVSRSILHWNESWNYGGGLLESVIGAQPSLEAPMIRNKRWCKCSWLVVLLVGGKYVAWKIYKDGCLLVKSLWKTLCPNLSIPFSPMIWVSLRPSEIGFFASEAIWEMILAWD